MITTEQHLAVLTAEVLRDLGRNEAAGWAVRKAAVKMLIERGHAFANHPDFRDLRLEIKEEQEAHAEVESLIGQVEEKVEVQKMDKEIMPCTHGCVHNGCVSPHPDCEFHSKKIKASLTSAGSDVLTKEDVEETPGPFKASFTTKDL